MNCTTYQLKPILSGHHIIAYHIIYKQRRNILILSKKPNKIIKTLNDLRVKPLKSYPTKSLLIFFNSVENQLKNGKTRNKRKKSEFRKSESITLRKKYHVTHSPLIYWEKKIQILGIQNCPNVLYMSNIFFIFLSNFKRERRRWCMKKKQTTRWGWWGENFSIENFGLEKKNTQ